MKKTRIIITTFVIAIALLFSGMPAAAADCGDYQTRNRCGTNVGCDPGQQCVYESEWKCVENEEKCGVTRVDNSENVYCGITFRSKTWCGVSGGCAAGYLCTNDGLCVQDKGCENSSNEYNKMCGSRGTVNSCGTDGGCAAGYRCIGVNSRSSGTGYACLDMADNDNNFCPGSPNASQPVETIQCDIVTNNPNAQCNCAATGNTLNRMGSSASYCCGLATADACYPSQAEYDAATGGGGPGDDSEPGDESGTGVGTTSPGDVGVGTTSGGGGGSGDSGSPPLDIFAGPNSQDFSDLNPLEDSAYVGDLSSPGGIISRVLLFAFPIAGLILFLMLVWAGFEILSKAPSGKSIDAGKQRATAAIVGFILLFCTYWIMQIVEYVFGIVVL